MDAVDVVIPSRGEAQLLACLRSLKYIPYPYTLFLVTEGEGWAKAANIGLRQTTRDVILLDDDVEILPTTFSDFEQYYPYADVFGFKLLFSNGEVQHAGCWIDRGLVAHRRHDVDTSVYCGHVTTSLVYIKREVLDVQLMAEDYPGYQFEDVDFNFRAIDNGFRVLYVPNPAIHHETLTKRKFEDFNEGMQKSWQELCRRFDVNKYAGIQPFQPA